MPDPILVVPYDPNWRAEFQTIGGKIRGALGTHAIRIDHIGSTAVEGLDAKPIVDVQVSVASLASIEQLDPLFEAIGYRRRVDNIDLTKRYYREMPGSKRVHIHVRERGSWSEQFALLFRDYLRIHPVECRHYAETKYRLMALHRNDRERYVEEKSPVIWEIMQRASSWSQAIGWRPGEPDA